MRVVINYDSSSNEFKLYSPELNILLTSSELFRILVLFNESLKALNIKDIDILKSDDIDYILDAPTMKKMISSNVTLIKKLSKAPSDFQISNEKFGMSTQTNQLSRSQNKTSPWDNMINENKSKGFRKSKLK